MALINYTKGNFDFVGSYTSSGTWPTKVDIYVYHDVLGQNADGSTRVMAGLVVDVDTYIQQNIGMIGMGESATTGWLPQLDGPFAWITIPFSFQAGLSSDNPSNVIYYNEFASNSNFPLSSFSINSIEYVDERTDNNGIPFRKAHIACRGWFAQEAINVVGGTKLTGNYSIYLDQNIYYSKEIKLQFSNYITITPKKTSYIDNGESIRFDLYNPNSNLVEIYAELVGDNGEVIIPRENLKNRFSTLTHIFDMIVPPDPDNGYPFEHIRPELYEYMYDKKVADCYIRVRYRTATATNFTTSTAKITISLEEIGQSNEFALLCPRLNYSAKDINPITLALTGDSSYFVRYFSNVEATLSAEGVKGAKIVTQEIRTPDAVVGTDYYLFENITTPSINFYALDSRGYTNLIRVNQRFLYYVKPTASITDIGLPQIDDTCHIIASGMYWNDSFGKVQNKLTFYYRYKSTSIPDYVDWIEVSNPDIEYLWDESGYNAQFNINLPNHVDSFTVQIMAKDKLTQGESGARTVRAYPIFDWSENDFHFNIPVEIDGDLVVNGVITSNTPVAQQIEPADYIIEQGTRQTGSGNSLANWTFRKWNSGMYECWCRKHIQTSVSTAWGNMYVSGALPHTNLIWPGAFIDIPVANITIAPNASGAFLIAGGSTNLTATNTGGYEIARGTSLSSGNFYINYYGMGRWK